MTIDFESAYQAIEDAAWAKHLAERKVQEAGHHKRKARGLDAFKEWTPIERLAKAFGLTNHGAWIRTKLAMADGLIERRKARGSRGWPRYEYRWKGPP